ncbi:hypothetical protein MK805_04330 [Shimazuella sp. AN120528]|uniref:hypothetical protein n=1 Tax=Shimazuella soli TaxID=1892854 RepID=UPI001F0D45C7|nr:hypothetical protein [Shimazuella soli]MCH5584194.1 hypothetical protein [Shimazuella soli]
MKIDYSSFGNALGSLIMWLLDQLPESWGVEKIILTLWNFPVLTWFDIAFHWLTDGWAIRLVGFYYFFAKILPKFLKWGKNKAKAKIMGSKIIKMLND